MVKFVQKIYAHLYIFFYPFLSQLAWTMISLNWNVQKK